MRRRAAAGGLCFCAIVLFAAVDDTFAQDDQPDLSIRRDANPVTEGEDLVFTLTRTGSTAAELEVPVTVAQSNASNQPDPVDFVDGTPPESVTFAIGDETATLTVPTEDDDDWERDGWVWATIGAGDWTFTRATDAIFVQNDDLPIVTLVLADRAREGEAYSFTVRREGDISDPVTLLISPTTDVLQQLTVYPYESFELAAEVREATFSHTFVPDDEIAVFHSGYHVRLSMTLRPSNYRLAIEAPFHALSRPFRTRVGGGYTQLRVIDDDLPRVAVEHEGGDGLVEGDDTHAVFRVWRYHDQDTPGEMREPLVRGAPALPIKIALTGGGDYLPAGYVRPTTVTIAEGERSAYLRVPVHNDAVAEAESAYTLTIQADADAYQFSTSLGSAVASLADDDEPPLLSVTANVERVVEGNDLVFTLDREGNTLPRIEVPVTVSQSDPVRQPTAVDFVAASPPDEVVFDRGAATATLRISTVDDEVLEPDGYVFVKLGDGDWSFRDKTAEILVEDNEPNQVTFHLDSPLREGDAYSFRVSRRGDLSAPFAFTVEAAAAAAADALPIDFEGGSHDFTVPAGVADRTFSATFYPDNDVANIAGVRELLLRFPASGSGWASEMSAAAVAAAGCPEVSDQWQCEMVVVDDDTPWVGVFGSQTRVTEGEQTHAVFRIWRSLVPGRDSDLFASQGGDAAALTVNFRLTGALHFFDDPPENAEIPAGSEYVDVRLPIDDDDVAEASGDLEMTVLGHYLYSLFSWQTSMRIVDDDGAVPDVSIEAVSTQVDEGTNAAFTLTRTGSTADGLSVTVEVAATSRVATAGTIGILGPVLSEDVQWPPRGYTGLPRGSSPGPSLRQRVTAAFAPGSATATLSYGTQANSVFQGDGVFVAGIVPGAGYEVPRSGWHMVEVRDTDYPEIKLEVVPAANIEAVSGMPNTYWIEEGQDFRLRWSIVTGVPTPKTLAFRIGADWESGWFQVWGSQKSWGDIEPTEYYFLPGGWGISAGSASDVTRSLFRPHVGWVDPRGGSLEVQLHPWAYEGESGCPGAYKYCPPYSVGAPNRVKFLITNRTPGITVEADDASVEEGAGATFTLRRTWNEGNLNSFATTVLLRAVDSGGFAKGDLPTSVRFAPGQAEATVTVETDDDDVVEDDGAITLEILGDPELPDSGDAHTYHESVYVVGASAGETGTGTATVAVTDNDDPSAFALALSPVSAGEPAGATGVTVTASLPDEANVFAEDLVIAVTVAEGSASSADFSATSATVTIAANQRSGTATVTITPVDDALHETDETLRVQGVSDSQGAADAVFTITDDDAVPEISIEDASAAEDAGVVAFTVNLDAESGLEATASWSTADGTADSADYRAVSGAQVRFLPGETEKTIRVDVIEDESVEPDETFTVTLTDPAGASLADATATGTITNDDMTGVVVEPTELTIRERGSGTYAVSLASEPTDSVVVAVTVPDNVDVSVDRSSLTFTADNFSRPQEVAVFAVEDADAETDDPVELAHAASGGGYDDVAAPSVTVTILEGTPPGVTIGGATVAEDAGSVSLDVTLSREPESDTMVDWATADGTATAGADYTQASGTLTFSSGEALTQTVTVPIADDELDEDDETFRVVLSMASGLLVETVSARVAITDNDEPPRIFIDDAEVDEGATGATAKMDFQVRLTAASGKTVRAILWASAREGDTATSDRRGCSRGSDFHDNFVDRIEDPNVVFEPGQTELTFDVDVYGDGEAEEDETFTAQLFNVENVVHGRLAAKGTIRDDDSPYVVNIKSVSATAVDEGTAVTVTLGRTVASGAGAPIPVRLSVTEEGAFLDGTPPEAANFGSEMTTNGCPVYTGFGDTETTLTISTDDDEVHESDGSFTLSLLASEDGRYTVGTPSSTTVTVRDDDYDEDEIELLVGSGFREPAFFAEGDRLPLAWEVISAGDYGVAEAGLKLETPGGGSQQVACENPDGEPLFFDLAACETTYTVTAADVTAGSVLLRVTPQSAGIDAGDPAEFTVYRSIIDSPTAAEGDGWIHFPIRMTGGTDSQRFSYRTRSGTGEAAASSGQDFAGGSNYIVLTKDIRSSTRPRVRLLDDGVPEETETFTLEWTNHYGGGPNWSTGVSTTVTATITDDDEVGVEVGPTELEIAEGGSGRYEVVLASQPSGDVTIGVAVPSGTDLSVDATTLTFTAEDWNTAQTVTVSAAADDDALDDPAVTISHTVAGADYEGESAESVRVTITESDTPVLRLEDASAGEDAGAVQFTVELSQATSGDVSVSWATQDLTAEAGDEKDYSAMATSTLSFTAGGALTKTISVPVHEDEMAEVDETFAVALTQPQGAEFPGGDASLVATGTIEDNDQRGVVFSSTELVVDEGESVTYTVVLSSQPQLTSTGGRGVSTVTVGVPEDSGLSVDPDPARLVFGSGGNQRLLWSRVRTVTVTAEADDDTADEGPFTLTHTVASNSDYKGVYADSVEVTIRDTTPTVQVSFGASSYNATEGGTAASVVVGLSADPERTVAIPITKSNQGGAANADYSGVPSSVTFTSGETSKTFTVTATDDSDEDDDESVDLGFGTLPDGVSSGTTTATTVNLVDNDDPAVKVSFGASSYNATEGGDDASVVVGLSADPERTVAIPITKSNQGGAANADYSGVPSTVTFTSGETSKTFTVTATDDSDEDDDESVDLGFGTLPDGVSSGTTTATTVNLVDNDDPAVKVSYGASSYNATEGGTAASVVVGLSADPERTVAIPITKSNQGGAANADYSGVPSTVTFTSGETSKTFTVTATDDTDEDDGESVDLGFGTLPTGVSSGSTTATTVNLVDNDDPAVKVSFGASSYEATEGGDDASVVVGLSADPERTVAIPITKSNQGGAANADYSGVPSTVTFTSGETSKTFTVTATDDSDEDDGESVDLGFGTLPDGVSSGTTTATTVNLVDNDDPAVKVSFGASSYNATEGGTAASVVVELSADPERTVAIPITKSNQGGAANADYSGVPSSVTFTSGETSKTFTVTATDDSDEDDGESVDLGFGTLPTGVSAGSTTATTVNLVDNDDPAVKVSFGASSYNATEGGTAASVVVGLSADPERTVAIPITKSNQGGAANADYSGVPSSVTFTSGQTSKTFTVTATDDTDEDDGESVDLGFGTLPTGVSAGSTTATTVNLVDNDDPAVKVSFGASSYNATEGGTAASVVVALSVDPERTVAIPITKSNQGGAANADYSGVPSSVTFTSGETSKTFTVTATDDTDEDDGESVDLGFGTLPDGVSSGTTTATTVNLVDNDDPAVKVSFGASSYNATEGGTAASVVVGLSADPERTVAIPITKSNQGGAANADYSGVPSSVTFTSGQTSKTFTVTATDDTDEDDGESVDLGFGTLPTGVSAGSTTATTVNLVDNDDPAVKVSFGASSYNATEGGTAASVVVALSADPERTVAIPITKSNQGGAANADYSGVPSSVTFTSGQTSKTFTVTATDDTDEDDGESVDLGFGTLPDGVSSGTTTATTVNLVDNDDPAVKVSFGASSYEATEGGTAASVVVGLSADPERTVAIPITKSNQGGAANADYSGVPSSVTFTSGQTSKTFTVTATDDTDEDDGESVDLGFGTLPTGVSAGSTTATTVNLVDNDDPAVKVSFGASSYNATEGGTAASVVVALSVDPERTVAIPITKSNQGGAANADYSGVPSSVTFTSGETSKTFTVTATDDTDEDDGESVDLGFGTLPTGVSAGSTTATTVNLVDNDDPAVKVSFGASSYNATEGGTAASVVVALSVDPERTVAIPITKSNQGGAANADYSGVPSTVTFTSGQTSKTFTVTATDDTDEDDGESVDLGFGTLPDGVSSGTTTATTVNLVDNDDPAVKVSFGASSYEATEGGTAASVVVGLSADPERTVAIPITKSNQGGAANADYSGVPSSVTFTSGETSKTFTVTATDDTDEDDGESVDLGFGTLPTGVSSGSTTATTVNLVDNDDPAVKVSFGASSYNATEGGTAASVVVGLSADPERTVAIPITKSNQGGAANADYSGVPSSVTFTSGETSKTFTVTATDDTDEDDGESVDLGFGTLPTGVSAGSTTATTVNLVDNDDPAVKVSFGASSYNATEGGTAASVVVALSVDPERTVAIPITKSNQGGAANADYSGVPSSVTFTSGETSKTFTVTATDDTDEDDGESVDLGFGTLPTGVSAGSTTATTVNLVDNDDPAVKVSYGASSYTATEGGTAASVVVGLSADPERTVAIPITKSNQGGAANADYSGVPSSVTFTSGQTSKTFTVTATDDTDEDDGESVDLGFGTLPDGVSSGTTTATTVNLVDNDDPAVKVSFGASSYNATEGGTAASVVVGLSADPERTVAIPITKSNQGGAANADYSGVPSSVTFTSGQTSKTFTVTATDDTDEDDGESVDLGFGTLPTGVSAGSTTATTVNLVDNDDPAVKVSFGASSYNATEGGTAASVVVALSVDPERTVAIPITKSNQGGAANADYSGVPSSVTFTSGETSKTFTVTATDDTDEDDGESVDLGFGTLPDGVSSGTTTATTVNLVDNDDPAVKVSFGASSYNATEGGTAASVVVGLSADPERTVAIPITKSNQGGAANADYSGVPSSVTFTSGQTSKTFTVTATDDTDEDDGESVDLGFGTLPTGVSAGSTTATTVNLVDNDDPAVKVSFGASSYNATEGGTAASVVVALSADPERTVAIPITKSNQGGAANADYSGVPSSVTFTSGQTSKTFTVTATDDTDEDDGESVDLGFGTLPDGVSSGTTTATTVNLVDNDDPAVKVSFGASSYNATEGGTAASVVVGLSADPERTVAIPITKSNQGGAANADYSGVPSTVTFTSGQTSKTFTVTATDDTDEDDGESVDLGFGTLPTGVSSGSTTATTVNLVDNDDPAVKVSFGASSYNATEGGTAAAVVVELSADPERTVAIPITKSNQGGAANADYSGVPSSVTFTSGETSKTFTVTATDDSDEDDGESVDLGFGTLPTGVSSGSTTATTVNLIDNDDPAVKVSFGASSYNATEGGTAASVVVELSADPERTVAIPITKSNQGGASNDDYSGVPSSVTFTSGETSKTFTVTATDDSDEDDGESVDLGFGTLPTGVSSGSTTATTVNLVDNDDPAVKVSFGASSYNATEGGTAASVVVELSADPERTVAIPITKSNQGGASNDDYSGVPSSVTFTSGETSKTLTVTATDDSDEDDGESVDLGFGTLPTGVSSGSTTATTVNLVDNDDPAVKVSFGASSYNATEGGTAASVVVELSADPERTVAIPITKSNQGGASNDDYSGVPSSVTFTSGQTSKTFTVTATDDTDEDDGESVDLGFGTLPTGVSSGSTTATTVNLVDNDDPAVKVSFGASSYNATEGGTAAAVVVELSADPERTVAIPITKSNQGGASNDDYSGVPSSVTFTSGETSKTFTVTATDDSDEDDGESVDLGFGTLPTGVSSGSTTATTVNLIDNDDPAVKVSFGASSYNATEGGTAASVVVELSADPERTVAIPITKSNQGGAANADYSGVPSSVTFTLGETSKTFTVTATDDSDEDDGESVDLGFGTLPTGVSSGSTTATAVNLVDNDDPAVRVSFGASSYDATEGGTAASVVVGLSADPERTVAIPITKSNQGGASNADYSGVPSSVTFTSGETSKTFTVTAEDDEDDDDGESVGLGFGTLPDGISAGSQPTSTVTLVDDDDSPPPPPQLTISFGASSYEATEGGTAASVVVSLSADPGATVEIPITRTNQGGASDADYSGVPTSLTFSGGATSGTFTVVAEVDEEEEDGESVDLGFGTPMPNDISVGSPSSATVALADGAEAESPPPPPNSIPGFPGRIEDRIYRVGTRIEKLVLPQAFGGDGGLTYLLLPELPPGLSYEPADASISGTPTSARARKEYTWSATDEDGDSAELRFGVTVQRDRKPRFAGPVADQYYVQGVEIELLVLPRAFGGDGELSYALSSTLPAGLSLEAGTRRISGTPTTSTPRREYTWTATDEDGDAAETRFGITVLPDLEPAFAAPVGDQTYLQNSRIEDLVLPDATGGNGELRYDFSGDLPPGLSFDDETKRISGVPTVPMDGGQCVWTATDEDGDSAELRFDITVREDLVPEFRAEVEDRDFLQYTGIQAFVLPEASGGNGELSYELSPKLPAGLFFDEEARRIAGTPTVPLARREYVWTATDEDGDTAELRFGITIREDLVPEFRAEVEDRDFLQHTGIQAFVLPEASGGNGELSYELSPKLPAGLFFDEEARRISGTPTVPLARREYVWTATDEDGDTAELRFGITVRKDLHPSFSETVADQSWVTGLAIEPLVLPAATGGNGALRYALRPALPAGVKLDPAARTISGAPGVDQAATPYTWTAVDADRDSASTEFSITVSLAAPEVDGNLLPLELWVGGGSIVVQAEPVFRGDRLSYLWESAAPNIASVKDTGSSADVSPGHEGETEVAVTASNSSGAATVRFAVTVRTSPGERAALEDALAGQARALLGSVVGTVGRRMGQSRGRGARSAGPGLSTGSGTVSQAVSGLQGGGHAVPPPNRDDASEDAEAKDAADQEAGQEADSGKTATSGTIGPAGIRALLGPNWFAPARVGRAGPGGGTGVRCPGCASSMTSPAWFRPAPGHGAGMGSGYRGGLGQGSTWASGFAGHGRSSGSYGARGRLFGFDPRDPLSWLLNQSFSVVVGDLPATGPGDQTASPPGLDRRWSLWGAGDRQHYGSGRSSGEWRSLYLGADRRFSRRWFGGLSVSRGVGESDYSFQDDLAAVSGRLTTGLTAVYPYASGVLGDGWQLWMIGGAGSGDASNRREHLKGLRDEGSLTMRLLAAGTRKAVSQLGAAELALHADAALVSLAVDGERSLTDLEATVNRSRIGLELVRRSADGLEPFGQLNARYDAGDGAGGAGLETVAGVRYRGGRLAVEAQGRWLALHSDSAYEEYGAGARFELRPREDRRGWTFSLAPRWGEAQFGTDLWREGAMRFDGPLAAAGTSGRALSLDGQLGYGLLSERMRGVLVPQLGYTSDSGRQRLLLSLGYESRLERLRCLRFQVGVGVDRSAASFGSSRDGAQAELSIQGRCGASKRSRRYSSGYGDLAPPPPEPRARWAPQNPQR